MKLLFLGDVMGRSGRTAVARHLPRLKERLSPDVVIVNGENAAHGIGLAPRQADMLLEAGVDVLTTGNHVYNRRDIIPWLEAGNPVVRPANYPAGAPGRGFYVHHLENGESLCVIQLMGRLFMEPLDNPFAGLDDILARQQASAVFVDFHAEATSEKMAMGHYADGRVAAVVGTHTHVPTGDAQILPGGTAYMTDAGMCGDYDSVIGMDKTVPVEDFRHQLKLERFSPAGEEGTLCGAFVETRGDGMARRIEAVRCGPRLAETIPRV